MKKKHLLIGFLIVIFSFYYAFKNVSIEELFRALSSVQYIYLIPSLVLVVLTFFFRALRWHYLVRSVKEVPTARLYSPMMIGFMGNILPARAGEIIRAYMLAKQENISFSASFATIFVERLFDMMLFLLLLVYVLVYSSNIFLQGETGESHRLFGYMVQFGWISFIGVIFIFCFSVLLQYKNEWAMKIVGFIIKPLPEKWRGKVVDLVGSFTQGLSILKDYKAFMAACFYSFMVWFVSVASYYPIFKAFGLEAELPMVTAALVVSLTVGIFISLFPSPAFLGSYQLACVVALHEIFGVSKAVAASYGIVSWLVVMGFIISTGLIFLVKDNISFSELSKSSQRTG